MTRLARFNITVVVGAAIAAVALGAVALAQGTPTPDPNGIATSPGGLVDLVLAALRTGAYGVVTLALIEVAELGLLAWARRQGSPLSPYASWIAAAVGVTGTALASLVASGEAGLRAIPVALITAGAAYYMTPVKRAEATDAMPPAPRKTEAGIVDRDMLMPIVGVGLVAIGIAILVAALTSCGPLRKAGDAAKDSAIDCAKADVFGHIKDVTMLLEDGGATWEHDLEQLGLKIGEDAIACEVRAVVAVLEQTSVTATPATMATTSSAETRALINGRVLMARKGWRYTEAP